MVGTRQEGVCMGDLPCHCISAPETQQAILQGEHGLFCPGESPNPLQFGPCQGLFGCGSVCFLQGSKDGGPAPNATVELVQVAQLNLHL